MNLAPYIDTGLNIIHKTSVDFVRRNVSLPVNLVQYDTTVPMLAVELYNDGKAYELPDGVSGATLRFRKPNCDVVLIGTAGYGESAAGGSILYFPLFYTEEGEEDDVVVYSAVDVFGIAEAVVELDIDGSTGASSPITFYIDRNPIQNGNLPQASAYPELDMLSKVTFSIRPTGEGELPHVIKENAGDHYNLVLVVPPTYTTVPWSGLTGNIPADSKLYENFVSLNADQVMTATSKRLHALNDNVGGLTYGPGLVKVENANGKIEVKSGLRTVGMYINKFYCEYATAGTTYRLEASTDGLKYSVTANGATKTIVMQLPTPTEAGTVTTQMVTTADVERMIQQAITNIVGQNFPQSN